LLLLLQFVHMCVASYFVLYENSADADMEIRGGGMDMAQVRAEEELRPKSKQVS
jgi:hypothetical protein